MLPTMMTVCEGAAAPAMMLCEAHTRSHLATSVRPSFAARQLDRSFRWTEEFDNKQIPSFQQRRTDSLRSSAVAYAPP